MGPRKESVNWKVKQKLPNLSNKENRLKKNEQNLRDL